MGRKKRRSPDTGGLMSRSIRVGDIEIIPVTDGQAPPVEPSWPFPSVPVHAWDQHGYALDQHGKHRSNFGAMVLRTPVETVLVDTGLGPHAPARYGTPPGELPHSLKSAGVNPDEVSVVFLTHLHYDHIGWAMSETGAGPFFKNARYVASKTDWSYWQTCDDPARAEHSAAFKARFEPLYDQGKVELVDGEEAISAGVRTLPTPGHTPGHMSLLLESSGERGIVTGDVFHSAAQFAEPEWSHRADVDPEKARATRKLLLARMAPGVVIASGHLVHGSNIGTVDLVQNRKFWRGF